MIASVQLADRLALDVQSAQALRAGARANDPETLRAVARQFEALVVQTMLKSMRATSLTQDGDVLGDSQSMRLYRDMLDQQWAQKMAAGKGLGFAEAMVQAMTARAQAVSPEEMARLAQPEAASAAYPLDPSRTGAASVAVPAAAATSPAAAAVPAGDAETASGTGADGTPGDYRQRFLDQLRPHAERVEAETGIPARFILAHAALETGWGRYTITNADGTDSHNLFGVKAGASWAGDVASQVTTEYQHGLPVRRTERFRAYGDYTEALRDYAGLLGRRYQAAYRSGTDPAAFAQGLASGGYATDPDYAGKLKGVIASVAALEA